MENAIGKTVEGNCVKKYGLQGLLQKLFLDIGAHPKIQLAQSKLEPPCMPKT